MARPDIEAVIGADPRPFNDAMRKVMGDAARAGKGVEGAFDKAPQLAAIGRTIAAGFAAAGISVAAVGAAVASAASEFAGFERAAARAGLELGKFQETRLAAQAAGLSGKDADQGLEAFNRGIAEAIAGEGRLKDLFEANNIRLTDRAGKQRDTNVLLGEAAELVRRAATEADKLSIAEALGLTREWVPLLERGAAGLEAAQRAAADTGAVIDKELVAKAREFQQQWDAAVGQFVAFAQRGFGILLKDVSTLIAKAREFSATLTQARDLGNLSTVEGMLPPGTVAPAPAMPRQFDSSRFDIQGGSQSIDARQRQRLAGMLGGRVESPTVVPRSGAGGGGGGGGADSGASSFEREIAAIQKRTELARQELETFGQSEEAIRRARLELEAKQKVEQDGVPITEAQTARIRESIEPLVQFEAQLRNIKQAQEATNEAVRFFGGAASSGLSDLAAGGKKAEKAIENLKKKLVDAALQAAFLGDGPLGKIFGLGGTGGKPGGLFGLFGSVLSGAFGARATGGPVRAGRAYMVGENGPEPFFPGSSGFIGQAGGSSGSFTFAPVIDARGADAGAVIRIERVLAEQSRNFGSNVQATNRLAQVRNVRA